MKILLFTLYFSFFVNWYGLMQYPWLSAFLLSYLCLIWYTLYRFVHGTARFFRSRLSSRPTVSR